MSSLLPQLAHEPIALGLSRLYERLVVACAVFLPLIAFGYLEAFQDPSVRYVRHGFHEFAIAIAIAQAAFVAFVAWRCYLSSGEPLQRWLTAAFLTFAVVYAPHGLFTPVADQHLWLFLIYGPISRLGMAALILVGVLGFGRAAHPVEIRHGKAFWYRLVAALSAIDLALAYLALEANASPWISDMCTTVANAVAVPLLGTPMQMFRLFAEGGAALLSAIGAIIIVWRRQKSSLMLLTALSLAYSAESSLVFILARPWDPSWWLAHLISATGFTVLSYGVIRAFHTTRDFASVFSQEEYMHRLVEARQHAEVMAAQLKSANELLEERVAERTHQLEVAKTAAEAANVAKSAFLTNMGHELRTPLHQVSGLAQLLERDAATERQAKLLRMLTDSASRMTGLVNAILELTNIESQQVALNEAPLALEALVRETAASIRPEAEVKQLALHLDIEPMPAGLQGDAKNLKRALLNYLSNAIRFTEAGHVTLRLRLLEETGQGALVRFEVEDTGIGIARDDRLRLFKLFEQVDNAPTRHYGGLGAGLVMTRKIAQLMGGEAGCESSPGIGSTFWFTARLRRVHFPDAD